MNDCWGKASIRPKTALPVRRRASSMREIPYAMTRLGTKSSSEPSRVEELEVPGQQGANFQPLGSLSNCSMLSSSSELLNTKTTIQNKQREKRWKYLQHITQRCFVYALD